MHLRWSRTQALQEQHSASAPKAVASALAKGLEMIAAAQVRPELTIAESLQSVAAIHDLLAAGRGSGKYVTKVPG